MQLESWQQLLLALIFLYSLIAYIEAVRSINKGNVYGLTPSYYLLGSFVWGDALIFGLFWMGATMIVFLLSDWILLGLIFSVFWTIRSLGETIYWFNHQFTTLEKNKLTQMPGYKWIKSDALWFIYQIMTQCVCVISIIISIYFSTLWIRSIF